MEKTKNTQGQNKTEARRRNRWRTFDWVVHTRACNKQNLIKRQRRNAPTLTLRIGREEKKKGKGNPPKTGMAKRRQSNCASRAGMNAPVIADQREGIQHGGPGLTVGHKVNGG